jgi:hypothetical protein
VGNSIKIQTGITLDISSVSDFKAGFKYSVNEIEEFRNYSHTEQDTIENLSPTSEYETVIQVFAIEKETQKQISANDLDDFIEKMVQKNQKRKKKKDDTNAGKSPDTIEKDISAQFSAYTQQIEKDLANLNLNWDD